jgi:HEAT repeat protein
MGANKFHGKSLEHWLAIRVSGGDDARLDAVNAIRQLCTPAESVPLLVEALEDHFWRVRAAAALALYEMAQNSAARPLVEAAWSKWERAADDPSQEVRKGILALMAVLEREG